MTTRTTQSVVNFSHPFLLPGFDRPQPAGEYRVDQDEELIEGNLSSAWLRVGAFIHLPAIAATSASHEMVPITLADLEAALEKDQKQP